MIRDAVRVVVVGVALAIPGCGDPGAPYVFCDEDVESPPVSEPVNAGGLAFIDATEVTQEQYQRFLDATAAGSEVSGQPSYCSWNTTYAVDTQCLLDGLTDERMLDDVVACGSRPQTCIDWCDAYMYCESVGKHLCGSVDGGRLALDRVGTMESEWYIGCSAGGQHNYGAGDFDQTSARCNTLSCYDAMSCAFPVELVGLTGTMIAPGTMRECQSPQALYAGIFDMTGNVREWTNACDNEGGAEDLCARRGGAYTVSPTACDFAPPSSRSTTSPIVGFRCCGNPDAP